MSTDEEIAERFQRIRNMDRTNFEVWDNKADEKIVMNFMKMVEGVETAIVNATLLNLVVEANVRTMMAYQPMRDDEILRTDMAGSLGRYVTMKILGIYDGAVEEEQKQPRQ